MRRSIACVATMACVLSAQATLAMPNKPDESNLHEVAILEDVGATDRINLSGKLRMLSQRIPSAACHLVAGIDVEGSSALLAGAKAEFAKILNGLEFGDEELNIIGPEKRRKTLAQIHELRERWKPFEAAVDQILAGETSNETIEFVLSHNLKVLGEAKLLVSEIVHEYADPTSMTQAGAVVIDIAGRQRMLTQKISWESCTIWSGHASAEMADQLNGTMQMFEVSLMALRNGMDAAGIKAPPNQEIAAGLDLVIADWNAVKASLTATAAGTEPTPEIATATFQGLNKTMADMNKVVGMYTEAEKLGL